MPVIPTVPSQSTASSQDRLRLDAADRRIGVPAGRVLAVGVVGLGLAIALNAQQLLREAQQKPFGPARDASIAVWEPIESVSSAVGLHLPRLWADETLGRPVTDPGATPVASSDGARAVEVPSVEVPAPAPNSTDAPLSAVVAEIGEASRAAATIPETAPDTASADTATAADAIPQSGAQAAPTPDHLAPTPDHPLRLAVIGDSMVRFFGDTMVSLAHETGVIDAETEHRLSSGLTRPDFYDWPARLVELLAADDPDAVVLMFGGNDAQGIVVDGQITRPFADTWVGEYSARVRHMMDLVTTDPDRVLIWVGQPIMRDPDFDQKMVELNKIYAAEAAARQRVRYVDTRDLFRGPNGGFSRYVIDEAGQRTDVRLTDGVHLSTIGGRWLSQLLLAELGEMVDLSAAALP